MVSVTLFVEVLKTWQVVYSGRANVAKLEDQR